MTRQTKIQIVLAFIALAVIAWAAWPGRDEGAVSVTYAGAWQFNPHVASFTITNRTRYSFSCFAYVAEHPFAAWTNKSRSAWPGNRGWVPKPEQIDGYGAMNYQPNVSSTNRWRVEIVYHEVSTNSLAFRTRLKLMDFAGNHGYPRIGEWIRPKTEWKHTYGLVMLGNKPVPP